MKGTMRMSAVLGLVLVAGQVFAGDEAATRMTDRQGAADSAALASGTAPVRVMAGAGGVAAGVDLLQAKEAPGFLARNWGKLLTGAVAGGAGYLAVARNNDMWPYKRSTDSGSSGAGSSTSTRTSTSTVSDSHGSPTVVVEGNNGPVNVNVDVNTGSQTSSGE